MDGTRNFGDYINPTIEGYGSAVVWSTLVVNNFEIKASTIQVEQKNARFGGLPAEDSNQQITNFLELSNTDQNNTISTPNKKTLSQQIPK